MGVEVGAIRLLSLASQCGVDFQKTLQLGHQSLHANRADLERAMTESGVPFDPSVIQADGFADSFFQKLGCRDLRAMDAHQYEGAGIVHDLNRPIARNLEEQFSLVFDGGTTEHVFNFPMAIENAMKMVSLGGHYIGITVCNNFVGHGFYQFSPELFFNVMNESNGFELERLMFFEDKPDAQWYEISDPRKHNRRVTFMNGWPSYLLVIARKTATVPIFANSPQQSDYTVMWDGKELGEGGASRGIFARIARRIRYTMLSSALEFGESRPSFNRIDPFA
jgi:hypothetical protein